MYDILKARADALRKDLVAFTQKLVKTSSITGDEERVADHIEAEMKEVGYDSVFRDDTGNVIGVMMGRENAPTILLNSHMDTVAPDAEDKWIHSPYSGEVENGRIYGVGAADCKGGIAAHVYAGALLKSSLLPLNGNLIVALTVAEGNGQSVGARALMRDTLPELGMTAQYAILGEPTNLGLYYGHDGWLEIEVKIAGNNPFCVDDAANTICKEVENGGYAETPEHVQAISIKKPRFENHEGFRCATINMIRRLTLAENAGEVIGKIKRSAEACAQSTGCVVVDVDVRKEEKRLYNGAKTFIKRITNAWETDPFDPLIDQARKALVAAGVKVHPAKWRFGRLGMGTAGSVYVKEFQVPTIGYGPGAEEQAHSVNEYVLVDNLVNATYGTAVIAHSIIGIPVYGWTLDDI